MTLLYFIVDSEAQEAAWLSGYDLKSGDPEFKSHSVHQLDLFQVAPGSTPRLCLYIANWSAACQLVF